MADRSPASQLPVDDSPRSSSVFASSSKERPVRTDRWYSLANTTGRLPQLIRRPETGALVAAVLVYAFFALVAGNADFVSVNATASWLNAAAELGIVAIPIGLLLIAGEFDLSIGSMVGAASVTVALGSGHYDLPLAVSVGLAFLLAAVVGTTNGLLVVKTGLPSFIVTIGANFILAGTALGLSTALAGTSSIAVTAHGVMQSLFGSKSGQAHVAILWWLAITLAGGWLLAKMRLGNWIYAIGGSRDTARAAGVPVARVKILLFVTTAFSAALVGVIQAIEFQSGNATNGQGFVFQAPIVAVIGGVLLTGGYGSAFGIFLGTITFGIINLGIFYAGWSSDWQQVFLGALLLIAVLGNNVFRKMALSSSSAGVARSGV